MKTFIQFLCVFFALLFGVFAFEYFKKDRFWADILLMPQSELSEFEIPFNRDFDFTPLRQATIDDDVGIKFLLSAMELRQDSTADVSFDLDLIAPDGSRSEHTTLRNTPVLTSAVDAAFNVHSGDKVLTLVFDSEDLPGIYNIHMRLRDNVSGDVLEIIKQIELIE